MIEIIPVYNACENYRKYLKLNCAESRIQKLEACIWVVIVNLWTCVYCAYIPQQIEAYIYINKQTRSLFLEMVDE
jgi:hypothetical protein